MIARFVAATRRAEQSWRLAPTWPLDLRAGWTSALVMLPQAVILAALAGLPPEMGVYASVFPVVIAAWLGASPRLLSGPNTAVAAMIAAALAPFAAPFSGEYCALALVLTLLVGGLQCLAWAARMGRLFEVVPDAIVRGVTLGVGLVIIASQLSTVLGVLGVPGEAPWLAIWYAVGALDRINPYALIVAAGSVAAGTWCARSRWKTWVPPLVASLAGGTILAWLLDFVLGSATVDLERVGRLSLVALPLSMPALAMDELYIVKQLLQSALAIALIGCLQTVIIARSLAERMGDPVDSQRELLAQGAANLVAAFTSGFAGSGSFNRSEAHLAGGARTPLAAIASAVLLFLLVVIAGPVLAFVPAAAMAGTLLLIGQGLIRSCRWTWLAQTDPRAAAAVTAIALLVLAAGLETAVLWSLAVAAGFGVWRHARAGRSPGT